MLVRMGRLSTKRGFGVYGRLKALLFPPACLFCHTPMAGDGCCPDCYAGIHVWPRHGCPRCGRQLPEGVDEGLCGHCLNRPPAQAGTTSLLVYQGPVREAILDWKLSGHHAPVRWLIDAARPRLRELLSEHDLLLPVPMPLSRMRKSGQHHAADLSRWLAEASGCHWDWRILRRIGEQARQSSLAGRQRWNNLRKAFAIDDDYLTGQSPLHGIERIWIVDDILTSGATLHYAARAATCIGRPVHVLSLARTKSDSQGEVDDTRRSLFR